MINRIYQGRVTCVDILGSGKQGKNEEEWQPLDDWETRLWDHHAFFQDAVNYYVMALLALATDTPECKLWPIRSSLAEVDNNGLFTDRHVWTQVRRRGVIRTGMRESVASYLGLDPKTTTPEKCYKTILKGNKSDPSILDKALKQLLDACQGGDGKIRDAAPEFHPFFCNPYTNANFKEDPVLIKRRYDQKLLPILLYDENVEYNDSKLEPFDIHSIATPNKIKPTLERDQTKKRLSEALKLLIGKQLLLPLEGQRLEKLIESKPDDMRMPNYVGSSAKGAVKTQLYALMIFKYVEKSEVTYQALRKSFSKPKPSANLPEEIDFASLPEDSIKVGRGERGYIFKQFTTLAFSNSDEATKAIRNKIDIAAFEEALKALHQVDEKGEERKKEREKLERRLACMKGEEKWNPKEEEVEESEPCLLKGDPRIERLTKILESDLAQEYELIEGQPVSYGLRLRTIRGFSEIRREWNRIAPEGSYASNELREKLKDALSKYQQENSYSIGSVRLFEELLHPENWIVWQEPSPDTLTIWRNKVTLKTNLNFTRNPLTAFNKKCQLEQDIERLKEPIRFTPADACYSKRQFYFSDVCNFTERGDYRHERNSSCVIVPLVIKQDGKFSIKRARLRYSAPRLRRDHLRRDNDEDLKSALFLQPMMEALGLSDEMHRDISALPVALMPEEMPSGRRRILLNFPIELDTSELQKKLGFNEIWKKQFATFNNKNYYLRWPSTISNVKATPEKWWWDALDHFSCLAVDLGQRDAGAFGVLDIRSKLESPTKTSREIGRTNNKIWWATLGETGLFRLPGEDTKVFYHGVLQTEFYGEKGRLAEDWEWKEALKIAKLLCPELESERFAGRSRSDYSFPEQNDNLLRCLRLAQSRHARLQSLSWQLLEKTHATDAVEGLKASGEYASMLAAVSDSEQPGLIAEKVNRQLVELRQVLQTEIVRVAQRILPLRDRNWEWARRADQSGCHVLRQTETESARNKRKIAGQRGLSLKRVEQLENLRQRAQALNRALMQEPGVKPVLGRTTRGKELPDPCPEILEKLDRIKEQRINQTAHLILARALGLRLIAPNKSRAERSANDIHGEYESFRPPVDFIVMEDLSRYLSSQGRAPRENSRLMKWCHRAVLGKLKELCEPYGIPIVEATAAYSSRFCSRTGLAGFRAQEVTNRDKTDWYWQKELARLQKHESGQIQLEPTRLGHLRNLRTLFNILDQVSVGRFGKKPRVLIVPRAGGALFVPAEGSAAQADINAAINIGLRAIAAPDCHCVQVRIRSSAENCSFTVQTDTKREKARWGNKGPEVKLKRATDAEKLASSHNPNFFVDQGKIAQFDRASIDGFSLPVSSARGLWGTLRQKEWVIVNKLNNDRFEKWGNGRPLDEGNDSPSQERDTDFDDDIPY